MLRRGLRLCIRGIISLAREVIVSVWGIHKRIRIRKWLIISCPKRADFSDFLWGFYD